LDGAELALAVVGPGESVAPSSAAGWDPASAGLRGTARRRARRWNAARSPAPGNLIATYDLAVHWDTLRSVYFRAASGARGSVACAARRTPRRD